MYRIIGGDQREYGPVSADLVRQWILEGRANGNTQAQLEGSNDWKNLSAFAEFAEALASHTSRFFAPPPAGQVDPTALADAFSTRGALLDIGRCVSRSWDLLMRRFWLVVGASATILLINIGLEFIPMIGQVAGVVFSLVFWAGLDWLFLKLVRGQPADLADAFAGFQISFLQLMLAGVVTTVLIMVGLCLCLVPGIYLMVAWMLFAPLLIMDKQLDFWPALELSRQVVTRNFWSIFGLFMLTVLIMVAGVVALGVGIFVALPLATGAIVFAYEDLFGAGPGQAP